MSYCIPTEVIELMPLKTVVELLDDTGTAVTVEEVSPLLVKMISKSDALIDTQLRSRYPVPLTSIPEIIKTISIIFTKYNCWNRRGYDVPGSVTKEYDDGMRLLKEIRDGQVDIGIETDTGEDFFIKTNKTIEDNYFNLESYQ